MKQLNKIGSAALLIAAALLFDSCSRENDVTPRDIPAVSGHSDAVGDISLTPSNFITGQPIEIKFDPGLYTTQQSTFLNPETVATVEFWRNGVLVLSSRHVKVTYADIGGSNNLYGFVHYTVPAVLSGVGQTAYVIKVIAETPGKCFYRPSSPVTTLQVSGVFNSRGEATSVPAGVSEPRSGAGNFGYYSDAYYLGWTAQLNAARAFFVNQSTGVAYEVFTPDQITYHQQHPDESIDGFANSAQTATLSIGEMIGSNYLLADGTYKPVIDNGLFYAFPYAAQPSASAYRYANGSTITIVH